MISEAAIANVRTLNADAVSTRELLPVGRAQRGPQDLRWASVDDPVRPQLLDVNSTTHHRRSYRRLNQASSLLADREVIIEAAGAVEHLQVDYCAGRDQAVLE
jgi:hypothetical protein